MLVSIVVTFCTKMGDGVVTTSTDSELLLLLDDEVTSTDMVMLGPAVGRKVVTSALSLSLLLPPPTSKCGTVVYSSEVTTSPELSPDEEV